MRSTGVSRMEVARTNGAAHELEPASVPLSSALEDVADAARRVVGNQLELLVLELRDMGRHWLGGLLLARVALPFAGLAWLAVLAALSIALARRFDWPLALLAIAGLNLVLAAAFAGASRRLLRSARELR